MDNWHLWQMAKSAVTVILSLIGTWMGYGDNHLRIKVAKPATFVSAPRHSHLKFNVNSLPAASPIGKLSRYKYMFEGQVVHDGNPCALAGVTIRITSSQGAQVKTTLTDQDGNYSLPFYIYAQRYEPLRWKIETYRDGIGRASLVGQRIAMAQEDVFVLDHALALAHASSGTDPSAMMREDRDLGPQ